MIRHNRRNLRFRQFAGFLLALSLLVSPLMGFPAQAGEGGHSHEMGGTVLNFDTPLTAGGTIAGGNYYLAEDVTLTKGITIGSGKVVNLCLNGHTLKLDSTAVSTFITVSGELHICDCQPDAPNGTPLTDPTAENAGEASVTGGLITGGKPVLKNSGVLELYGGTIAGSTASSGINNGKTFHMYGGAVLYNKGTSGGGITNSGSSAVFTMEAGRIANNAASSNGGGVNNATSGTFTMNGGTIENNAATASGGGVYNAAKANVSGGTIQNNASRSTGGTAGGGGIFNYGSSTATITVSGGEITGNQAASNGGGIGMGTSGTINLTGGKIHDNTAAGKGGGIYLGAVMNLSGEPVVSRNTVDGQANDVHLGGTATSPKTIGLTGPFTGSIGVVPAATPTFAKAALIAKPANGYGITKSDMDHLQDESGMADEGYAFQLNGGNIELAYQAQAEEVPQIAIDYLNEQFTGFVQGKRYSIQNSAMQATHTTAPKPTPIPEAMMGTTVEIVCKGHATPTPPTRDSAPQSLNVPARPAAPAVTGQNESTAGKKDGKLIGVSADMEIKRNTATAKWGSIPANLIWIGEDGKGELVVDNNLKTVLGMTTSVTYPITIWVREKAVEGARFASGELAITIEASTAMEQLPVPDTVYIDYAKETLAGFTVGENYLVRFEGADGTTEKVFKPSTSTPEFKLESTGYSCMGKTLEVLRQGNGTTTSNSEPLAIAVPQRPQVTATVVNTSYSYTTDGQLTGLQPGTQYRKGSFGGWESANGDWIGDLAAGDYQLQIPATGSNFISEIVKRTIAKGPEPNTEITVTPPVFPEAVVGYEQPTALPLTIQHIASANMDTVITKAALSSTTQFTLEKTDGGTVELGKTNQEYAILPKTGLKKGSYSVTVTVTYQKRSASSGAVGTAIAKATVGFEVKGKPQNPPPAPTLKEAGQDSITLNTLPKNPDTNMTVQYSIDGGNTWQSSTLFSGLAPITEYEFVARYNGSSISVASSYEPSAPSAPLKAATLAAPVYTVTFNANGGQVDLGSAQTSGTGKLDGLPAPVWAGHSFAGWFTAAEGGEQVTLDTVFTGDTEIFAHWAESSYPLSFQLNGGKAENLPNSYAFGQTLTLPVPAREGFLFAGWYLDSGFAGDPVTEITPTDTGAKTFYAKWTEQAGPTPEPTPEPTPGPTAEPTPSPTPNPDEGGTNSEVIVTTPAPGAPAPDESVTGIQANKVVMDQEAETIKRELEARQPGTTVDVKVIMRVEPKAEANVAQAEEIKAMAGDKSLAFLDISMKKVVNNSESDHGETSHIMEIVISFDFAGKGDITMYRSHNGTVSALTQSDSKQDGTFQVDRANGKIYIYTQKFSTYAIGYKAIAPTATPTPTNTPAPTNAPAPTPSSTPPSGGSGGGGGIAFYQIVVEKSAHGTVTASPASVYSGGKVSLSVQPERDYQLDKLTVMAGDKEIEVRRRNGQFTFTMPAGNVKVWAEFCLISDPIATPEPTAEPTPAPSPSPSHSPAPQPPEWECPFADVRPGAWYYQAVEYVSVEGLMNGYANGLFVSGDTLSRGMLAQILYNREGRPEPDGNSRSFQDIAPGDWYAQAVGWAAGQEVVKGYGNGLYGPNDPITREQLAVMLWRYLGKPRPAGNTLNFPDGDMASAYAREGLCWAEENGIVTGKSGWLDPRGRATRAETAQMLKNCFGSTESSNS